MTSLPGGFATRPCRPIARTSAQPAAVPVRALRNPSAIASHRNSAVTCRRRTPTASIVPISRTRSWTDIIMVFTIPVANTMMMSVHERDHHGVHDSRRDEEAQHDRDEAEDDAEELRP